MQEGSAVTIHRAYLPLVQHHHPGLIRSSLHVHMDKDNCLEVLVLEGKVKKIKEMADNIISMKGIKNGKLVLSSVR